MDDNAFINVQQFLAAVSAPSVRGTVLTIMTINTVKIKPLAEREGKAMHLITGFSVQMDSLQTTSRMRKIKNEIS